jgi:hypothetical protein
MTIKDYVYLGLILLTALAFYCNGFYAGVYRCKRIYDNLIDEAESDTDDALPASDSGKLVLAEDKPFVTSARCPGEICGETSGTTSRQRRSVPLPLTHSHASVTAPKWADLTAFAYLANTPRV